MKYWAKYPVQLMSGTASCPEPGSESLAIFVTICDFLGPASAPLHAASQLANELASFKVGDVHGRLGC